MSISPDRIPEVFERRHSGIVEGFLVKDLTT